MTNPNTGTQELREARLKPGTSEYSAIHYWAGKEWGKPKQCEHCQTTESSRYEWANLSSQYLKERSDWARLCASCHRKLDTRRKYCPWGHEYTEENSYFRPNDHRDCRACHRRRVAEYGRRHPEKRRENNARRYLRKEVS